MSAPVTGRDRQKLVHIPVRYADIPSTQKLPSLSIPWAESSSREEYPEALGFLSLAAAGDMSLRSMPNERVLSFIEAYLPGKRFFYLKQEHTRHVHVVDRNSTPGGLGDGLITRDPEIALGVTAADCLPIFLFDPEVPAWGVLHSGWKGTGILKEALRMLRLQFGSTLSSLYVTLGPCIGACCYNVPRERALGFQSEFGKTAAVLRDGLWFLDLKAANRAILDDAGVKNVLGMKECTFCDSRFSSYRRDGSGEYTRMLAGIGMPILNQI